MSWRRYNTAKALFAIAFVLVASLEVWRLATSFSWYRVLGDIALACALSGLFLAGPYKTKAKP